MTRDRRDGPGPWKVVEDEVVHEGRVFRLRARRSRSPRTGSLHDFQVIDSADWVNVVPLTPDGHVVLIRQWRHGIEGFTLEVPGGMIDPGEDPATAARRELREETGYDAGAVRDLGVVEPNPAIQNNRCHTFLATGCELRFDTEFDSTEETEVVLEPVTRIPDLVRSGAIRHALVIVAFHHWELAGRPLR